MKNNKLKILSLLSVLLSCFICICTFSKFAESGEGTDTNKTAVINIDGNEVGFNDDKFYVYEDSMSSENHYVPSGWMGDFSDLKIDYASSRYPKSGKTCIRIRYNAKMSQGAGWAGIFWQQPANNWGDKKGGYNLTGAKKLTFWARGAKGGEKVAEFKMGGIAGEYSDSDSAAVGPIELTSEWKKYSIDLKGKNLSYIIGGFCLSVSRDDNPKGSIIYLDNIAYE